MSGQHNAHPKPKCIEHSLLNTCGSKQPVVLDRFVAELGICTQSLKRACTAPTLTEDLTREYAQIASNIRVVTSFMRESQSGIESILTEFSKMSVLSVPMTKKEVDSSAPSSNNRGESNQPYTCPSSPSHSNARQRKVMDRSHDILKGWCNQHLSYLFPKKEDLLELVDQTGLTETQVNLWFRNARTRSGWSKLYGNKLYANKDRQKLQSYFDEYDITRNLHGSKAGSSSGSDGAYVLVQKIHTWFRVKSLVSCDSMSLLFRYPSACEKFQDDSISPWVEDVLFGTLAALRPATALSPSQAKKASCFSSSSWSSGFNRSDPNAIDSSLRSSSPDSASNNEQVCPRSTCTSSTWSSISPTSSRSTSPSVSSSSPPSLSACSSSSNCSTSPRSAMLSPVPISSPQMSFQVPFSHLISHPSHTASHELHFDPPSSLPHLCFNDMVVLLPSTHESTDISSPPNTPVPLDPRLDTSTPSLSFFSSDTFSPPCPTHEPRSVTSGQFDDAEED